MNWQQALGGVAGSGRLRAGPADFRVDECLGFAPDGEGEHVLLWIRKQGANTAEVAQALAVFAGVKARAVGTSGRKDRHADTGQWFSVHLPGRGDPDWAAFSCDRWQVGEAQRHRRRLRTGTHRGNRFHITVRDFAGDPERVAERMRQVAELGFPNYFGPQRFGRSGANIRRAHELFAGTIRPNKGLRGLYLSAARSWLFNQVLMARVDDNTWLTPQADDALMLAGTQSMFCCQGSESDLAERIARGDLHVTGPLWGQGRRVVGPAAEARERDWLAGEPELREGLEQAGLRADRRPLRALASGVDWSVDGADGRGSILGLAFTLPAGAFATALLAEVVATDDA